MRDIRIIEKPDWISWDDIHDCLWEAHESNRKIGVNMRTAYLSGEELKKRIGPRGKCFVALVDGNFAGTASIKSVSRNTWYHKGELCDFILVGIYPQYKGLGIYKMLLRECASVSMNLGINVVELDTAEGNTYMQAISKKHGFKCVAVKASPYTKHYSVVLAMWTNGCPFYESYVKFRFKLQEVLYKLRFKRGHIKRFGI